MVVVVCGFSERNPAQSAKTVWKGCSAPAACGVAAKKPQGFFVGLARGFLLSALEALEKLDLTGMVEVVGGDAVDVVHIAPN